MTTTLNKGKELVFSFLILSLLTPSAFAEVTYSKKLSAEELEMGVLLEWKTTQEVNSHLFVVESSEDGTSFNEIATLLAAGTSEEEMDYRFFDLHADGEKTFYRLREVYQDGSSGFSHTIILSRAIPNRISIININTSEVENDFLITLNVKVATKLHYTVSTQFGDLVYSFSQDLAEGTNSISIPMSQYEEGIYKILLQEGKEKEMLVIHKIGKAQGAENMATSKKIKH